MDNLEPLGRVEDWTNDPPVDTLPRLFDSAVSPICESCYEKEAKSQCKSCGSAFYCSKDCQTKGWHELGHKEECDRIGGHVHSGFRLSLHYGFWFHKLIAFGEEWYRGRLIENGRHKETGELPDATDPDGHLGFTAENSVRWLITHHWFGGDDGMAAKEFYSPTGAWFFNPTNPRTSIMGIFAAFRWGKINESAARVRIHNIINAKRLRPRGFSILWDGFWFGAIYQLFNDTREVPNPLKLPKPEALRNEVGVIITHHLFGKNADNTANVMHMVYPKIVEIAKSYIRGTLTEKTARQRMIIVISRANNITQPSE